MHSEIQNITPYYSKFENILPEELPDTGITEELIRARNEINNIIEEDLKKIKDLATRQNRSIMFNEFTKPPSVIKMAFYIEGESSYDDVSFYYAHWTMSFSTLQSLAQSVINTSTELKTKSLGIRTHSKDACNNIKEASVLTEEIKQIFYEKYQKAFNEK